jgi:hypothetical protein
MCVNREVQYNTSKLPVEFGWTVSREVQYNTSKLPVEFGWTARGIPRCSSLLLPHAFTCLPNMQQPTTTSRP